MVCIFHIAHVFHHVHIVSTGATVTTRLNGSVVDIVFSGYIVAADCIGSNILRHSMSFTDFFLAWPDSLTSPCLASY